MLSLRVKLARLLSVPANKLYYDQEIDTFCCQCGCGMELSVFCLAKMRQTDRRLFKRLHRILRNGNENLQRR